MPADWQEGPRWRGGSDPLSAVHTRMQPEVRLQLTQCSRSLRGRADESMIVMELTKSLLPMSDEGESARTRKITQTDNVTWAIPTGVAGLGQGPSGGSGTWHNSSLSLQDQCPFAATTHGFKPGPSYWAVTL